MGARRVGLGLRRRSAIRKRPLCRRGLRLLPDRDEAALFAGRACSAGGGRRTEHRSPVLIVIDEGAPTSARRGSGPAYRAARELRHPHSRRGPQVRALPTGVDTAPGRRIPENVLSQADNLVLMRLQLASPTPPFAQAAFSFWAAQPDRRSATFRQGEGLSPGSSRPGLRCSLRRRITQEGGATCPPRGPPPAEEFTDWMHFSASGHGKGARPGSSSTRGDAADPIPANAEGRPQPFTTPQGAKRRPRGRVGRRQEKECPSPPRRRLIRC